MEETLNQNQDKQSLPWWNRISSVLIMNSLFLGIVPVFLVIIATLLLTQNQINSQIFNQLESVAVLKQQQISKWIDEGHSTLRIVAESTLVNNIVQNILTTDTPSATAYETIETVLIDTISADQHLSSLYIYKPNGEVIVASSDLLVGRIVNRQPYFQGSLSGDIHTQAPYYDVGSRTLTLIITNPIFNTNGELIGILAGSLNTTTLAEIMLDRTGLGDTGETYIVSSENNYLLTASRFEGFNPNQAYNSFGIDSALNGESGETIYEGYRGVQVFGNYQWIPEIQTALLAEVEVTEAFTTIRQLSTVALGIAFLAAIVAVSIGLIISLRISRPIASLAEVANKVSAGDLSQRVQVQAKNEIGQLADTFNSMTEQLQSLIGNLEHRVNERTRDLNIAAQVSQQVTRVLELEQLLPYLANLTLDGFDLSHVSVFVYDNAMDKIRLAAGSGIVGRKMLETGKQFNLDDKGLVPLAARTSEPQIINDVTQSPDHFVNPLLPETQSELAVPMRVGTQLIGVLDLQSNEKDHFTREQVNILTALADQIAIAVRNADLFKSAQKARAEAEQANVVKSQFLSSMSHELRTPLNAILNFTQFVSTGMLGEVNNEQVDMLDKVVQSGKHLLSLINDVLDISKIEAGALKLFVEDDVDMAQEAKTIIATAESMVADKPIQLVASIDENLPLLVGDKRRLRQVMLNLTSNACKFTEKGEVKIRLQHIGDSIQFSVRDTGQGIADEDHELIFETFRQTQTGLRQGEGTGLGLPISRRLVEVHGGTMWMESVVHEGSTFYFSIPVHNPELKPMVKRKEVNHVA